MSVYTSTGARRRREAEWSLASVAQLPGCESDNTMTEIKSREDLRETRSMKMEHAFGAGGAAFVGTAGQPPTLLTLDANAIRYKRSSVHTLQSRDLDGTATHICVTYSYQLYSYNHPARRFKESAILMRQANAKQAPLFEIVKQA